ncbi:MAG: hypothetical protein KIT11_05370 [Fimbriimonadaceae bacterium]|nr:hypothetical protein [Fimbriimonadaceae bacterium]QYK56678.1 MAG: hypothetical protein KF733_04150 [Fimbriimonadaceae bacterium]
MPVGDSLTAGAGSPCGYRQALKTSLPFAVDFVGPSVENSSGMDDPEHAGFGGWRILDLVYGRDGQDGVVAWLDRYRPDAVLLMVGTNDYWSPLPEMESRYRLLLDAVTNGRRVTVFLGSVTRSNYGQARNDWAGAVDRTLRALSRDYAAFGNDVRYVDMYTAIDENTDLADLVHPNRRGYDKIAARWKAALTKPRWAANLVSID